MKKLLFLFLIFSFPFIILAQEVKRGYIFTEEVSTIGFFYFENIRFTPSLDDIEVAEKIIKENKEIIRMSPNYHAGETGIFNRYNRYFRQYFGFINDQGEKIILINYIGDKNLAKKKGHIEPIMVLDGGNFFWEAVVNINNNSLIMVSIHGES